MEFKSLYPESYFSRRKLNDNKRLLSFLSEEEFLRKHVNFEGRVCDVGCSTGEFLKAINWKGPKYGMEISEYAIQIAEQDGIDFTKNVLTENNFFDLIIFRGTIQHLPEPFSYISRSFEALKPGGVIAFLATPNSDSIVYKFSNTLPVLYPELNFFIPSESTLINVCKNYGFHLLDVRKPYLKSPYSNILFDHLKFLKMILFRTKPDFPFWGNMMDVVMIKDSNK